MVSTADSVSLQQPRQALADAVVQIRSEMRNNIKKKEWTNPKKHGSNRDSLWPAVPRPYRISDPHPKGLRGGGNEKGEFRNLMSDMLLRMQARSDQEEKVIVIAVDCTEAGDQSHRDVAVPGSAQEQPIHY